MRFSSSSIKQTRSVSKGNMVKGIIPNNFKDFNPVVNDEFDTTEDWEQLTGTWSTSSGILSTSTPASSYPILASLDLRSQDISALMTLDTGGPGVVFWLVDANNWWAAATQYLTTTESYYISRHCYYVSNGTCFGWDGTRAWGCERQVCTDNYGTRTRYNFYIKLFKSVNGTVTEETNILPNSSLVNSDNINGIELTTSGNIITVRARDASNNFYGTSISYTATAPNKGYRSGVIYTPGTTNLASSNVDNISIVGV